MRKSFKELQYSINEAGEVVKFALIKPELAEILKAHNILRVVDSHQFQSGEATAQFECFLYRKLLTRQHTRVNIFYKIWNQEEERLYELKAAQGDEQENGTEAE